MRLSSLIAALLVAAPLGLHTGTASARFFEGQSVLGGRLNGPQAPWCVWANNAGAEEVDCSFGSFAACNREARRSNGFCTQNFSGTVAPVRRKKANRERRY